MNKIATYLYFILIFNACYSQNNENMDTQYLDLNEEFTVKEFQDIVGFILKNGDRQTYCNMYNNNPHYKFEGIDVFLNPINQAVNWSDDKLSNKISDYNKIVIRDFQGSGKFCRLTLYENNVLLDDVYNQNDQKARNLIKNKFFQEYLPGIKKELENE